MSLRPALIAPLLLLCGVAAAHPDDAQEARGRQAVLAMAGCYLVDYSYVEVESLKTGYAATLASTTSIATSPPRNGSPPRCCRRGTSVFVASCSSPT